MNLESDIKNVCDEYLFEMNTPEIRSEIKYKLKELLWHYKSQGTPASGKDKGTIKEIIDFDVTADQYQLTVIPIFGKVL